jgi:protein-tyrosine phosphatase
MAEVLLRRHLSDAGVDASVSSAGLYEGGVPATAYGVEAMAERGLDLREHRSRQFDREMLDQADLIIGMAREHVREAAVLNPDTLARAFTLKELVRLGSELGPRRADQPLPAWLARVASARLPASLLGVGYDEELDVEDPIGRGRADYDTTAKLLDDLLGRVVALAFPVGARPQERTA